MILLDQAGAGAHGARVFLPSRAEEPFIESFWLQKVHSSRAARAWRIVPDVNPYLIFALSRTESRVRGRCFLVGPRSRFADVTMDDRVFTCGARLRPGALPLLTRFPASDFTDRSAFVEDVFAGGHILMERLNDSASPIAAIRKMSDFLSTKWARHTGVIQVPLGGYGRVEEMATRTELPSRTLRSRLMRHIGLSPKRMIRIDRLHRTLATAQERSIAWAEIAASCGFADQAHMIREFRDLLGESPAAWSRRSGLPIYSRR